MFKGLLAPVLVAVAGQIGAAYLDGSLHWASLVGVLLGVYHAWKQTTWERRERAALERLDSIPQPEPKRVRAECWPSDW